jgi:hypothetical protein
MTAIACYFCVRCATPIWTRRLPLDVQLFARRGIPVALRGAAARLEVMHYRRIALLLARLLAPRYPYTRLLQDATPISQHV